ncbi:MAG: peptide chain release factor N(5)-glutamine methyltransferase [Mycobacteriaceae bacterium]|nr:peptide chain release factor N(5)-glutamine methyltransferase [Mycobacteriaceae bacterium]
MAEARLAPVTVSLRSALAAATDELSAAGVPSARVDAEHLAAHVLGVERGRLALVDALRPDQVAALRDVVAKRAERIPLQHLTGSAPMGDVDVLVGPGVFVPRLETELLLAWAEAQLETAGHEHPPVVVDLCTGSGALALALSHMRPDAAVHAVEIDPAALAWARRNVELHTADGDTPITLHAGDVTAPDLLTELTGRVDLVVANPPYIPLGAELDPEVAEHDPHRALFGGPDGLEVIRPMVGTIARLLRPGGAAGIEHDDSHGPDVAALLAARAFTGVTEHADLAAKPRFVTGIAPDVRPE